MIQTSLAKRIALAAAGGLVSCLLAVTAGRAAEIKVLTSVALTSALNQIAPNFEQATGNKLNIGYSLIADIRKRILDGETADVIILSRPVIDELDKQQKFVSGSITNVAGTPVALAIRAGAPKPDISTVDALKRTLLAAMPLERRRGPGEPELTGRCISWPRYLTARSAADLAVGIDDHVPGEVGDLPGPQACFGREQHDDGVAQRVPGAAGEHEEVIEVCGR